MKTIKLLPERTQTAEDKGYEWTMTVTPIYGTEKTIVLKYPERAGNNMSFLAKIGNEWVVCDGHDIVKHQKL